MSQVNKPYTFTNGQTADAGQVNQDFDTLYNDINGGLDDTNMKPGGITGTSIATEGVKPVDTEGLPYAQDVFGASGLVLSGMVATKDGTNANQVDITAGVAYVQQADGSLRRFATSATNFRTATASNTYYLDLQPDGTFWWNTGHSIEPNYITIATVTSDGSGNVNVITDTRNLIGTSATANTIAARDANGDVVNNLPRSNGKNPNLLFNPSFGLGSTGWTGVSTNGFSAVFGNYAEGGFLQNTASTTSSSVSVVSTKIPMNAGTNVTISGEMNTANITAGSGIALVLNFYTSGDVYISNIGVTASNGKGWTKYSASGTAPANTAYVIVSCYMNSNTTNTFCGWRKIKVENGFISTTFSDDNTLNTIQYKSVLPFGAHGQYRAPVLRGQTSAQATANANIGAITGSMDFKFNASEWSNNLFYAEAMIWTNNASATAYAGVWDVTSSAVVSGSEVSTTNTGAINLRSGSFSLTDGHVYRPYIRISNSAYVVYILSMDIISLN